MTAALPFLLALVALASALTVVGSKDRDPVQVVTGAGLLALISWSVLA